MNLILKMMTKGQVEAVRTAMQNHVQCPLLTCNKISYGYLNNDWLMVFANLAVLILTVCFLLFGSLNGKGISG